MCYRRGGCVIEGWVCYRRGGWVIEEVGGL